MSAARITSAAKAGGLEAIYAGLKPCSTPWVDTVLKQRLKTVFTWSEGKTSPLIDAD